MRRRALVGGIVLLTLVAGYGSVRAARLAHSVAAELDRAAAVAEIVPRPQSTIVFDRAGHPAFSFFSEQRIDVPLDKVSPHMVDALVAVEDKRFYSHHGLDLFRIVGAGWRNVRSGRIREGGSTLTQQLARASHLNSVRTFDRKLREAVLAAQLEHRYSKAQILEAYLNAVYFGEGYYGVEAASRGYFRKSAGELAPAEAALLAALVRSPSSDAPCASPSRALARRNLVLRLMREQGKLNDAELQASLNQSLPDRSHQRGSSTFVAAANAPESAMYFQDEVRRQLVAIFGEERVLRGGLRVYSTYDPAMQREAEQAITRRIAEIVKIRPKARDLQASFVALDPSTGDVRALVGGRDYHASSFNRATQARRQAGSAFKPIIYAAALERGMAPGTLLRDIDVPIMTAGLDKPWLPSDEHEASQYTLRRALTVSSNRAAAQLLQQVGITTAVYYAERLGISSKLPLVPSLALGTGEVTLLELTSAYTAFANNGATAAPRVITRVEDSTGTTIYLSEERHTQAISPTTAYLMSSMLADVVTRGTAAGARAAGFTLPAAGKTGTTDDYADAWFIGYTPHLVAGVWFGLDTPAPIMREGFGGIVAVPAWARFMRDATAGAKPDWYPMPADVEKVEICRLSGARATDACRHAGDVQSASLVGGYDPATPVSNEYAGAAVPVQQLPPGEPPTYTDLFPMGAVPPDTCPIHGGGTSAIGTSGITTVSSVTTTTATPLVDAVLHQTVPAPPAPGVQSPRRYFIDHVRQPDGSIKTIIRDTPR